MKIKKGDKVVVTTGKDKGKIGVVRELFPKTNKVIVEGISIVTKHIKPTQNNPDGGIEKMESPISVSNVMIVISEKKDVIIASRTSLKIEKNAKGKTKKVRIATKTGEEI